jgi:pimeloyl-ACP methyl ester carboxylesterase/DNA-binding CsgD family transcriptional regulator
MDAPPIQYAKTSDGYDIAYCVSGQGQPFVLLWDTPHGSTEKLWSFAAMRTFFEPLAERYRLVQLDNRGTGNSSRGLGPNHSCDDYVVDLEAVVDRIGAHDFVLFGAVFTSQVAVRYAARHPDRVAGLILLNPLPADNPWVGMKLWEDMYIKSWDTFLYSFVQTFYPEGGQDWVQYVRGTASQADYIAAGEAFEKARAEKLLPSINAPTLVMASREPAWPPLLESARNFASLIPSARLVLFDGTQNREIVNAPEGNLPPAIPIIEEFVQSLPAPGAATKEAPIDSAGLSDREIEVLRLLAQGKSNPEIAKELFITRNTVQNHVSSILIKLNLQNRAQAAVYAKEHGIS